MVHTNLYNTLFGKNQKGGNVGNLVSFGKNKNFFKLLDEKKGFLMMVFANLIVQLGITYYVMENSKNEKEKLDIKMWIVLVIGLFALIFVISLDLPLWLKTLIFTIFSSLVGYMLSFLRNRVDPTIIKTAIFGTMGIFGSMFSFGLIMILFGVELSQRFGGWLLLILLLYIIVKIVTMFMGNYSNFVKGFLIFGLTLFSVFIIYDTNQILQKDYYGDFITASMDYYLDIINIFVKLVNLMSLEE
jgi:FtsH-binding integral membrane protein